VCEHERNPGEEQVPAHERLPGLDARIPAQIGTVLVDTGLSETLDTAIAPYLASIGLAVDALDDLVVPHADVDHVCSNRRLRELSPRTRVWAGEAGRRWIESNACMLAEDYRSSEPYGFSLGDEALGWIEHELGGDAPVDVGLRGGETLRLGHGQRWQVLALPGHTVGHIGLWHAGERIALVVDAVLGRGVCDRAGTLLIPPRIYDLPGYRRTIATLRALAPERLLTAHYPLMDRAEAADFLDLRVRRRAGSDRTQRARRRLSLSTPAPAPRDRDALSRQVHPPRPDRGDVRDHAWSGRGALKSRLTKPGAGAACL
jgi:glyoxylase-like metal-dependent hydrolase (beta-lactamase superfamily II)